MGRPAVVVVASSISFFAADIMMNCMLQPSQVRTEYVELQVTRLGLEATGVRGGTWLQWPSGPPASHQEATRAFSMAPPPSWSPVAPTIHCPLSTAARPPKCHRTGTVPKSISRCPPLCVLHQPPSAPNDDTC